MIEREGKEPLYPVLEFRRRYYKRDWQTVYDIEQRFCSPLCRDELWIPVSRSRSTAFPPKLRISEVVGASPGVFNAFNRWLLETFGDRGPEDNTVVYTGSRFL